ncbi:formate/nitrite transporter family protein [Wukongibacter baidiensis]|uniref:formate/nitrite transporter family protein n=1 Tax=Wukongibacter baidiensis TaxID=1723361 RepID=UPI003D7F7C62
MNNKNYLTPLEIAKATIETGHAKATKSSLSLLLLGILAGAFIAFGAVGSTTMSALVGDKGLAKLIGAAVFPVGLMLVVMAGAELFTGNNLMTLGVMTGRYNYKDMFRNWTLVYIGNFIGSIAVAILVAKTGLYTGAITDKAIAIATKKATIMTSLGLGSVLSRAILCNIIVVLAVWLATGAKDMTSKIFACWFPIMLFVLSGYEHSIANMFFIYVGKYVGAEITQSQIWINNIIPVTIGNLIGGAVIVPIFYYLIFLKEAKRGLVN